MATGGPAGFAANFIQGFAHSQQQARARAHQVEAERRAQLNEALRLVKEQRENQEAIAKEGLAYQKAQAELDLANSELALLEQRRAQIMADPGKPFRDAALEGNLEKARERFAAAHEAAMERKGALQDLIQDRDARIKESIPKKVPGTFLRGALGPWSGSPERDLTPEERKAAIEKAEAEDTDENRLFAKERRETEREIRQDERAESLERGAMGGAQRALEVGRAEQGPINEEARNAKLFPIDKQMAELREKQVAVKAAMAAAAQEIQARQQQQQADQAMPGYQREARGGGATGKGGGLLGAITGKGGGGTAAGRGPQAPSMLPQAPSMGPQGAGTPTGGQPSPGEIQRIMSGVGGSEPLRATPPMPPGEAQRVMSEFRAGTPTVGQALGPVIQKIAQMPVPQAAAIAGTVLGGVIGQRKPKFGPQPSSGPLAPTREASPAIAMEGRGGGLTPQSTQLAVREALAQRGYSPAAQAAIMGNVQQESRFDPRATGDQGTAHGLFQYRGDRFGNLNKYAQSKGLDPYSPGTQVGFMDQEVTAMPGLKQRLNQSDPASGALLFGKQYERPRVVEPSRAANAERFYKGSQQMAGGPVQTGNYKGQEYSYQTQPASQQPPPQVPQVPQVAQQTPGPYPTVDSSTGKQGYGQKPDSPQPSGGFQPPQQAPAPKLMEAPQPTQPLPMGAQQSQPFQPQAAPDLSQHPLIHDERHLQSLKPGSFFRTPDGKLKIVPEQSEAGV